MIAQTAPIKQCAEALACLDVASALAHLAAERQYARPQIDDSLAFVIEGGRHPVVEQALSRDGTPFVANDSDLSPPGDSEWRPHLADHRPQHGGQIHVPAAECADRDPGADRQLRAGEERAHWCRRPLVLARRRRRRSGARALDLHGRDGGDRGHSQSGRPALAGDPGRNRPRHRHVRRAVDRLGDRRASARRQQMPRAVRHAFP